MITFYFGFQSCVRQESSVIRHLRFHQQRLPTPPYPLLTHYEIRCCLKKNQSTPRPSEHPPVMGGEMSKRLGGIKGCKCCCCLHIKSRSDLYSVPVPSNIRTGLTDVTNAFRGHRLTTQKGYTYAAYKTRIFFFFFNSWIGRDGSRSSDCAVEEIFQGNCSHVGQLTS